MHFPFALAVTLVIVCASHISLAAPMDLQKGEASGSGSMSEDISESLYKPHEMTEDDFRAYALKMEKFACGPLELNKLLIEHGEQILLYIEHDLYEYPASLFIALRKGEDLKKILKKKMYRLREEMKAEQEAKAKIQPTGPSAADMAKHEEWLRSRETPEETIARQMRELAKGMIQPDRALSHARTTRKLARMRRGGGNTPYTQRESEYRHASMFFPENDEDRHTDWTAFERDTIPPPQITPLTLGGSTERIEQYRKALQARYEREEAIIQQRQQIYRESERRLREEARKQAEREERETYEKRLRNELRFRQVADEIWQQQQKEEARLRYEAHAREQELSLQMAQLDLQHHQQQQQQQHQKEPVQQEAQEKQWPQQPDRLHEPLLQQYWRQPYAQQQHQHQHQTYEHDYQYKYHH